MAKAPRLSVAALNHPNICTLFHVGPGYLVMELIENGCDVLTHEIIPAAWLKTVPGLLNLDHVQSAAPGGILTEFTENDSGKVVVGHDLDVCRAVVPARQIHA